MRRRDFPPKPAHARLRDAISRLRSAWRVPSYALRFSAAGRTFQLHVAFGLRAGARRRAQALRIIDDLWVLPLLPPVTVGDLERALRTNPNYEATFASCRRERVPDRLRPVFFGGTRLPLFVAPDRRRRPARRTLRGARCCPTTATSAWRPSATTATWGCALPQPSRRTLIRWKPGSLAPCRRAPASRSSRR